MKSNRLLLTLAWLLIAWVCRAQYTEDILGTTYQQQTICMPDDYEGKTVSTLVRKAEPQKKQRTNQVIWIIWLIGGLSSVGSVTHRYVKPCCS